ncbi:MAG: TonB-dependent receptor [Deltaproteobacteria bacterium]|nr:TonB-dependent receptor [Deltaproteobacteria bacterium]
MKTLLASVAVFAVLAAGGAHAGPLAPEPRVIATLGRDAIERSGAQTLDEYLDTGIARYFLTGGQALLVLVNGRPYSSTSSDLDALPLSAIERIELLSGDSLGTLGGSAVRGAVNVVLRKDLDGVETRALARMPGKDGGDGWQGSAFWGGAVGKGRMTLGVDILERREIPARSREYSRSVWREGGSFKDTKNVSFGGNTVWIVQRDETGVPTGLRSIALGDCDPARGYTGPLINPSGILSGDKGCGFAYGAIMWNSTSYEQKSAILNLEHPLTEEANLHLDANFTRADTAFRYAPSVGAFGFTPNGDLLDAINEAAGSAFTADDNDRFVVAHRFVRHGNRDWLTDSEEYDISVGMEGRITESLGYDVRLEAYRQDAFQEGNTFVHEATIATAIREGRYDLADPFSDAPEHSRAIEESSLVLENDFGGEGVGASLALEGSGFAIGDRDVAWTAGFELGRADAHDITVYRGADGTERRIYEVLGTGGANYRGERKAWATFAEMSLPLAEKLDVRVGGRMDDYDDVGGMASWRLGAAYRASDILTLRASWNAGERAPSMFHLHAFDLQDHPYVECDPGPGSPPRECMELNSRQVERQTAGNPQLDPSNTERIAIGAEARKGPLFLNVEWYSLSRSDRPGQNSADWAMRHLHECVGQDRTNCIYRDGGDITIHDIYANIVDDGVSGINTRFGTGFRTGWGVVGLRGAWRHVANADLRIAGEEDRLAIPKNAARLTVLGRRGSVTATWTTYYRSSYKNRTASGTFDSWVGHDLTLDWTDPLGLKGARITAGVFNVTDTGLSVNTANPHSVDGPTEAGWGRTFFLALRMQF